MSIRDVLNLWQEIKKNDFKGIDEFLSTLRKLEIEDLEESRLVNAFQTRGTFRLYMKETQDFIQTLAFQRATGRFFLMYTFLKDFTKEKWSPEFESKVIFSHAEKIAEILKEEEMEGYIDPCTDEYIEVSSKAFWGEEVITQEVVDAYINRVLKMYDKAGLEFVERENKQPIVKVKKNG